MKNYKFKLTTFHINNFRVFDKEARFDIAPITILTGTNSSGKSSFTKALALLVKSYQKNGLKSFDFMTSNLNLTDFKSIKNNSSDEEEINFKLTFETSENLYVLSLSFIDNSLSGFSIMKDDALIQSKSLTTSFIKLPENLIDDAKLTELFAELPSAKINEISKKILLYLQSDAQCHKNTALDTFGVFTSGDDFAKSHQDEVIVALGFINNSNSTFVDNDGSGTYDENIIYTGANPCLGDIVPDYARAFNLNNYPINELLCLENLENWKVLEADLLERFFSSFKFIGAVRATQQIIYTQTNSPEFFTILSDYIVSGNSQEANQLLRKWIVQEFKLFKLDENEHIKDVFEIRELAGVGYVVKFLVNGNWTDLAALGYGVIQLFPIILRIATNSNGNFIIEEPEANLHPALQSKLADFFLDIINPADDLNKIIKKRGTRSFIIETHSEYLIRKFQFLTASPESTCATTDMMIYYFYHPLEVPKNEQQVKKIKINKNGSLSDNFGEGFTDEATSWKFELLKINNIQEN